MVQSQHGHRPPLRPVLEAYVNVSAATYTAKAGDRVIGVNRAGAVTVTLPTAEVRKGRSYTIKDESGAAATNNITVATEGAETIDGSATDVMSENYGAKAYYSDGSNWFSVPLLPVGSHTLASHSAKAHSDLTGVGTGDHHAEAHQADHNSGAADPLKLDDLASPDDNTDLDFSTSAHGLVPKGPNDGTFLKADGTWAAPAGGGAITREGGNTTEATTTSATAVDLLSVATLTIAALAHCNIIVSARKEAGSADNGALGLKINTTVVGEALTTHNKAIWVADASNDQRNGVSQFILGSRITNYNRGIIGDYMRSAGGANTGTGQVLGTQLDNDFPTVEITDVVIRGIVAGGLTLGADELGLFTYSRS